MVLRLTTERPEAVEAGFARVVGTEKRKILEAVKAVLNNPDEPPTESPYGSGDSAEK